jgi:hypothetical protein
MKTESQYPSLAGKKFNGSVRGFQFTGREIIDGKEGKLVTTFDLDILAEKPFYAIVKFDENGTGHITKVDA